jgi:hypothetical protein
VRHCSLEFRILIVGESNVGETGHYQSLLAQGPLWVNSEISGQHPTSPGPTEAH